MRTSPLEPFLWILAVLYPVAVAVFALVLFTSGAQYRHQAPSAWRAASDLGRGLMARDFVRTGELLGRTRAEIQADLGDPTGSREDGNGLTVLNYDAGPDGGSDRLSLKLSVDSTGRVVRAQN